MKESQKDSKEKEEFCWNSGNSEKEKDWLDEFQGEPLRELIALFSHPREEITEKAILSLHVPLPLRLCENID